MVKVLLFSYVGNLDARVNEEMVVLIFGQIGSIKRTKFVSEVLYSALSLIDFPSSEFIAVQFIKLNQIHCNVL